MKLFSIPAVKDMGDQIEYRPPTDSGKGIIDASLNPKALAPSELAVITIEFFSVFLYIYFLILLGIFIKPTFITKSVLFLYCVFTTFNILILCNYSSDNLNHESLRLVPHPYSWEASAGVCNLCAPINILFNDSDMINNAYKSASDLGSRLNLNLFSGPVNEINEKASSSVKLKLLNHLSDSSYGNDTCQETLS